MSKIKLTYSHKGSEILEYDKGVNPEVFGLINLISTLMVESGKDAENHEFLNQLVNEAVDYNKIIEIIKLHVEVE